MAAPRNRRHIILATAPQVDPFTSRPRGGGKDFPRPADRVAHAQGLIQSLNTATTQAQARREQVGAQLAQPASGIQVQFQAPRGVELKLESLESKQVGIEIRNVVRTRVPGDDAFVETATVFIPDGQVQHFLTRFEQYATEDTPKGHPKNRGLVDRIANIRLATLRGFWTDAADGFPQENDAIWWEIWLRHEEDEGFPELDRLQQLADQAGFVLGRRLTINDRTVCLARATAQQLSASPAVLSDLAELRKAKAAASFFADLPSHEQAEWAADVLGRLNGPAADAPAVCLLDSGVTRAHPLIAPALAVEDATAVVAEWGSHDNGGHQPGHGTEMAGLALYGDLAEVIESNQPVNLAHRLESVKILPPGGDNDPDLYGAITAQATSRPEIQAPMRKRVFSLAVTAAADGEAGQPTSWSAAIDALAAGRSFDVDNDELTYLDEAERDAHRLFVVCAGNISREKWNADHLAICDTEPVHDPAHAWNVLTVGACTDKTLIDNEAYNGWTAVANAGDLSPWSSTGVTLSSRWPNKPDVVFEGGNFATNGLEMNEGIPDLCLLSTFHQPIVKLFTLSNATSAATAQVARIAAIVSAEYPSLWPETLRALVVHSAEWTPVMRVAIAGAANKQAVGALLHRYGFGVPAVSRAIRSANDALTLVSQSTIRPYDNGKTREMHLHRLPWPVDVLEDLADQEVTLRVTLSYFVEPNPARRGWRAKHRYASHGLRFDVKTGEESIAEFRLRLNKAAAEDDEKPTTKSDSDEWLLGDKLRHRGSLHSDIWKGTAAELAARGVIGVYPVGGWWKDQKSHDRSAIGAKYALVVSIETDAEAVDIWTPVAQQVGVPIEDIEIDI